MRGLLHALMFWRWRRRYACHGDVLCCQKIDRPNCNNYGVPWEHK